MKNKIYALGLHILMVIVCFVMLIGIIMSAHHLGVDILRKCSGLIAIIIIVIYSAIAIPIEASDSYWRNYTVGLFITLVGFLLWGITMFYYESDLFTIEYSNEAFWIVYYTFLLPFKVLLLILNIKLTPIINLLICIAPSFVIGTSLTVKFRIQEKKR